MEYMDNWKWSVIFVFFFFYREFRSLMEAGGVGEEMSDHVFENDGVGKVTESPLDQSEEMDVVLADSDEEGAGEGLSEGKLVMAIGDNELSLEERRAEQIEGDVGTGPDGNGEGRPSSQEAADSIESGVSSLSLEETHPAGAAERTKEESGGEVEGGSAASETPSCDACTDNEKSDVDAASITSVASSDTQTTVPSQGADDEASDSTTASQAGGADRRVHVHLDNSNFNTFQYWRPPLPEVDIDFDVINGAPANIHVVAKVGTDSFWFIAVLFCSILF